MPARGTTASYRPVPADFDEVFVRLGWYTICDHYGAGWKTVLKWIEQRNGERVRAGHVTLSVARAAYVKKNGPARGPVRNDFALRKAVARQRQRDIRGN